MAVFLGIMLALFIGGMSGVALSLWTFTESEAIRNCWNEFADEANDW